MVVAQLRPEPPYVDVDRAGLDVDVRAPDGVEQLLAAEDATGVLHQVVEQAEVLKHDADAAARVGLAAALRAWRFDAYRTRLKDKQTREQQSKEAATRKSLIGSGDRSEREGRGVEEGVEPTWFSV